MQSTKIRTRADFGLENELFVAKFRLKLKKVGKTTRPFRYDLSQIIYDYTVKMKNRLKGLDLVDRVPEELWTQINNTGGSDQNHRKQKKCKGKVIVY